MRQKTDKLFEMQEIMRNFVVYLRLSDVCHIGNKTTKITQKRNEQITNNQLAMALVEPVARHRSGERVGTNSSLSRNIWE
ncbi:MAG: hypothetical protein IKG96_07020 [Bacteroidaceae bacterium]|nr:hypothetical protein [Bacteroidaceae bacterium]